MCLLLMNKAFGVMSIPAGLGYPSRDSVLLMLSFCKEPSWSTAELAWALVLMKLLALPRQIESMKAGRWQSGAGCCPRQDLGAICGRRHCSGRLKRDIRVRL